MGKPTTCGHEPHHCKGLCRKCYNADYYARTAETQRERARQRPPLTDAQRTRKRIIQRQWYEANRERVAEKTRAWRAANPERLRDLERARYALEPRVRSEAKREGDRAWRKANADLRLFQMQRRRARQQGAEADLTSEQWAAIKDEFDNSCAYCGRSDLPLQLEHMVPLCRGGDHTAENAVPSCPPCNGRKARKTAAEFIGWAVPPRRQNTWH